MVIRQNLEVNLIKIGMNMIANEHSSLLAAFDACAND